VPSRRNPAPAQSTGTADNKGAGLRSRAHATGAGLKPADSTRWVFLLLLSGAVSCCCCCCLSRRCCSWSARAAENLAAHRCSHLLSRSRGILLIAKAPGPRSPLGLKAHNARGPLKVHPVEEQSIARHGTHLILALTQRRGRAQTTGRLMRRPGSTNTMQPEIGAHRFPRRRGLLRWVQIALKPASKAPGLHRVFIRDKRLKFVTADSAFKRMQIDARACWLDTGEHHRGPALRTSGALNCNEWNDGR
jgi:hypothetical protein